MRLLSSLILTLLFYQVSHAGILDFLKHPIRYPSDYMKDRYCAHIQTQSDPSLSSFPADSSSCHSSTLESEFITYKKNTYKIVISHVRRKPNNFSSKGFLANISNIFHPEKINASVYSKGANINIYAPNDALKKEAPQALKTWYAKKLQILLSRKFSKQLDRLEKLAQDDPKIPVKDKKRIILYTQNTKKILDPKNDPKSTADLDNLLLILQNVFRGVLQSEIREGEAETEKLLPLYCQFAVDRTAHKVRDQIYSKGLLPVIPASVTVSFLFGPAVTIPWTFALAALYIPLDGSYLLHRVHRAIKHNSTIKTANELKKLQSFYVPPKELLAENKTLLTALENDIKSHTNPHFVSKTLQKLEDLFRQDEQYLTKPSSWSQIEHHILAQKVETKNLCRSKIISKEMCQTLTDHITQKSLLGDHITLHMAHKKKNRFLGFAIPSFFVLFDLFCPIRFLF